MIWSWKSDVRICVFLLMTTFTKMEEVVNVTVGENVKLECPFIFGSGKLMEEEEKEEEEEIRWTGGHDGPILVICNKYKNEWEDYGPNDGFMLEHTEGCDKNVVSLEARKPGILSYVCSLWSVGRGGDRMENNMTFSVRVLCSNKHKCRIKQLPSTCLQWSQLVDIKCEDPCGVENSSDAIEMHFEMNNEILHPDVVFSSHITLRENVTLRRETSSQVYCVSHNKSTACEFEDTSHNATIGITPLVNRVFVGETATFECIYEGMGINPEYEWWISHHDQLSRISRSISPILNISNVTPTDDGIDVRCNCEANEEILTAWATLDVLGSSISSQTVTSSSALSTTDSSLLKYAHFSAEHYTNLSTSFSAPFMSVNSNDPKLYTTDPSMPRVHIAYKTVSIALGVSLVVTLIITAIVIGILTCIIRKKNLSLGSTDSEVKCRRPAIYMTTISRFDRTESMQFSTTSQDPHPTYETIDPVSPHAAETGGSSLNHLEQTLSSSTMAVLPEQSSISMVQSRSVDPSLRDSSVSNQHPVDRSCDVKSDFICQGPGIYTTTISKLSSTDLIQSSQHPPHQTYETID